MKSYARLVKCFAVCCFFLYSIPAAGVSAPEPPTGKRNGPSCA